MTRDDIIRMALEHFGAVLKPSDMEVKLAALAVAKERDACAKVCEAAVKVLEINREDIEPMSRTLAIQCATAIRARGNK